MIYSLYHFIKFLYQVNYLFCYMTKNPIQPNWVPKLEKEGSRYKAIVSALENDIVNGTLNPGERLPTHRRLAESLNVALGTVTRAYTEAERNGLVQSYGRRGTFIAGTPQQHNDEALNIPDETSSIIEMSVDLPLHTEDPDLSAVLSRVARGQNTNELLRYHEVGGILKHRTAGALWLKQYGVEVSPENVVVCGGAHHALTVSLMAIAKPGDIILCDELTYPGIKSIAAHLHLELIGISADDGGLDVSKIESICQQENVRALYTVPSFHNPTTAKLSTSRRKEIAGLARKYGFFILEDDIHRLLCDSPPPAFASLAPDHTFFIASLSKTVAGGLRVGFLVPPSEYFDSVLQAIWATVWMVPTLNAEIATEWINDGTAKTVVKRKRAEAGTRQKLCKEILKGFPYKSQPNGYYIWLQLPDQWDSSEFTLEARRCGVAVTPSRAFVVGSKPAPAAIRVCLAAPESRQAVKSGIEIIRRLIEQQPSTRIPKF